MTTELRLDLAELSDHDLEMACSVISEGKLSDKPDKEELTHKVMRSQVLHILKELSIAMRYFNLQAGKGEIRDGRPFYNLETHNDITIASAKKAADMAGWYYRPLWVQGYFQHYFSVEGSLKMVGAYLNNTITMGLI